MIDLTVVTRPDTVVSGDLDDFPASPRLASLRPRATHLTRWTTLATFLVLTGGQPAAQTRVAPLPNQPSGGG